MGTLLFFDKDDSVTSADPLFDKVPDQRYKLFGKTNKVINFERIFVENQSANENEITEAAALKDLSHKESDDCINIDLTYEEVLNLVPIKSNLNNST